MSIVTEVRGRPLELAMELPPRGMSTVHVLLLEIEDSDGVVGSSITFAITRAQADLYGDVARFLAPAVLGTDVLHWGSQDAGLRAMMNFVGTSGLARFGMAAHTTALEDLRCRALGMSLGHLLGRRHDRVRAYRTGQFLSRSPDELVDEIRTHYESGLRAFKVQVGSPDVHEDRERIQHVRQSLPTDITLMAECGGSWNLTAARQASDVLADLDLHWLEDPLRIDQIGSYRELCAHSPVRVAAGEYSYVRAEFEELRRAGVSYVIADLARVGGPRAWWTLAEAFDDGATTLLPHLYPHVSAQLVSALRQPEVWLEVVPWFDQFVKPLVIEDGMVVVDDSPGSGFAVDPHAADDLAVGPWVTYGSITPPSR
jgi:L-alanine-DL-glutamate epimerase-like enolase superfamily enzyme